MVLGMLGVITLLRLLMHRVILGDFDGLAQPGL